MLTMKQAWALCGALAATGVAWAQPAHDDCDNAINIAPASLPFLSPAIDIRDANPLGEFGGCAPIGFSVWYKIRPTAGGVLRAAVCEDDAPGATVFDSVIQVYQSMDGTCETLIQHACNDDLCDFRSDITFAVEANTWYYIQVGQWGFDEPFDGEEHIQILIAAPTPPPDDRWVEEGDAEDTVAGAQRVERSGQTALSGIQGMLEPDGIDMFLIEICDPSQFSASTRGSTPFDTQLFLFSADGFGITFNDDAGDSLQSTITGQFVQSPGQYLIAVGQYNTDPQTSTNALIWNNQPFDVERAPDGPGAAGMLHHWSGLGGSGGPYLIRMTGAAFLNGCGSGGSCPACAADFNEDGGVDGGDVEAFYVAWEEGAECGDVNLDGGVDGGDVEAFFVVWEQGGC